MSPFYRPPSSRTVRPMRRRAGKRLLVPALSTLLVLLLALAGFVALKTHPRFAITRIVLEGVPDARRAETEDVTDGWIGQPTLFADIEGPVAALAKRSWVASVSARRIVPGTIAIVVSARPPVAVAVRPDKGGELWTVDRAGSFIGPYAGRALGAGDDFPVLSAPDAAALARGAAFLETLRSEDPDLVARASDVAVVPEGFSVTDRVARSRLLFGPDAAEPSRAAPIWRAWLALLPELERSSLPTTDADLRFAGRIVLKAPGDPGRGSI